MNYRNHDNREIRSKPEREIIVTSVCPNCHKAFAYNKQISRRKKYCSHECCIAYNIQPPAVRKLKAKKHAKKATVNICPRCGKEFKAHGCAKYCPECLEWLAYNAKTAGERDRYTRNFNTRKDCMNRPYICKTRDPMGNYVKKTDKAEKPKITVFGRQYETVKDLCEDFGIARVRLANRLKKGYTCEEAIELILNESSCGMIKQYVKRLKGERR